MEDDVQDRYEKALQALRDGDLTKEEFMLVEAEFLEWAKSRGQVLNG